MATRSIKGVVQHLRRAVMPQEAAGGSDAELLRRFAASRDDAAFTALVERHGPLVWGVCRRILGNSHDAEDAFQATFLVLARKAAAIASPELLASWLHGVARNAARKARAAAARRAVRERQVAQMPEPEQPERDIDGELQPLLDQELARLPQKYRVVVLLCELEGKTRQEAARRLGVPEGTVASRLARARAMLARRLARRGLAVSAGPLPATLSPDGTSACVPAHLATATVEAAGLFTAGQAAGVISPRVAALAEGVLRAMFLSKIKAAVAVLVLAGMLVAGVWAVAPAARPKATEPGTARQTKEPEAEGRRLAAPLKREEKDTAAVKDDGKLWAAISVNQPVFQEGDTGPGLFQINFTVVNDGDRTIDPECESSQLLVNGQELKDWEFLVANGPRDSRWKALPAKDYLSFGSALGKYFEKPGVYKVVWKGKKFRSPEIVFRVMPKKR